jgi:colicin import membrane protein
VEAARKAQLARAETARAATHKAELARAEAAHKAQLARAETAHRAELARAEAARVQAAKAVAHQVELARAAKAAKQEQLRLAKVATDQKRLAKAEQLRLARAEAKDRADAKAQAIAQAQARADARERIQLTSLTRPPAHAPPQVASHKAKPLPQTAKLDRKSKAAHKPKVERATLKAHKSAQMVAPTARGRAVPAMPLPHPGLMQVSTPRVDPSLGAADRQLARAYQGARAAGVSDDQLQLQQEHWAAARSAAAREAPWAVHDVYMAHIAEINGLARDAHAAGH